MKLTGNTILITGGATGIGFELAKALATRNNKVIICGRRKALLDEACHEVPGLIAYNCDVTDTNSRYELLQKIHHDKHAVNVLINNAAVIGFHDLTHPGSMNMAVIEYEIATNLIAPIEMVRVFTPELLSHPNPVIININSPAAVVAINRTPFYSVAKAGLRLFTRSLRHSLRGRIKVIEIYPPSVATPMTVNMRYPDTINPEDFLELLLPQLEKGTEEIWIGRGRILRLLRKLLPDSVVFALVNRSA